MSYHFIVLGFLALTLAAPHQTPSHHPKHPAQNHTLLPGHYLPKNITDRTFFNNSCTADNISIRKEWRSLTHAEKTAFVNAELCLMNLPAQSGLPGAQSRFDDFQAAHQQGTNTSDGDVIHYTPQFLAWHRWQLHAHETILKEECNYTGTLPWWDKALDAASGDFFQSDMWSNEYFGGNGELRIVSNSTSNTTTSCVTEGPFANRTLHIGPLEETTDYCFEREFNITKGLSYGARSNVEACYEFGADEFESFYGCMALYPHIAGHQATGGVMADVDSSPGDPVFYLHHNYLDRLYWQWQQISPSDRLTAIAGNTTIHEPATGWEEMTLDFEMSMFGIVEDVKIKDVVNVQGGFLCYAFEY